MDDPAFVARGARAQRRRLFAGALLWMSALGFPLSWKKAFGGDTIQWIGACFTIKDGIIIVTIPADKLRDSRNRP